MDRAKMRMLCRRLICHKLAPQAPPPRSKRPDLSKLTGRKAGRPRPLKVMTAQMTRDIDDFADEIETRHALGCHRLRRELPRIDTAQRHLGLVVAERSRWHDRPVVERRSDLGEALLTQGAKRTRGMQLAT